MRIVVIFEWEEALRDSSGARCAPYLDLGFGYRNMLLKFLRYILKIHVLYGIHIIL